MSGDLQTVRELAEAAMAAIRARLWLVMAVAMAVVVGVFVQDRVTNTAEARLLVGFDPGNIIQTLFNEPRQGQAPPSAGELAADGVILPLADRLAIPRADIRGRLNVEQSGGNDREAVLIARAKSPEEAKTLVDEWAIQYIDFRRRALDVLLANARREIDERVDQLLPKANRFQRQEILREVLALRATRQPLPDVTVISDEGVKGVALPSLLVLLVGLVGGCIAALAAGLLDGRLRTRAAIEAETGLPLLADMPVDVSSLRAALFAVTGTSAPPVILLTGFGAEPASRAAARALAVSLRNDGAAPLLVIEDPEAEQAPGAVARSRRKGSTLAEIVAGPGGSPEDWLGLVDRGSADGRGIILAAVDPGSPLAAAGRDCADVWLTVVTMGVTTSRAVRDGIAATRLGGRVPNGVVSVAPDRLEDGRARTESGLARRVRQWARRQPALARLHR